MIKISALFLCVCPIIPILNFSLFCHKVKKNFTLKIRKQRLQRTRNSQNMQRRIHPSHRSNRSQRRPNRRQTHKRSPHHSNPPFHIKTDQRQTRLTRPHLTIQPRKRSPNGIHQLPLTRQPLTLQLHRQITTLNTLHYALPSLTTVMPGATKAAPNFSRLRKTIV